MKRLFTTIGLVAMIIIVGCTDLDDVQRQIDELKARLKSVEQLTSNANSEITSIRALIDAVNKKLSVVSYKELADKSGYELTLSDGGKITLKHGAKGDDSITPVINVKQHSDGLLYWTINGNFLLDSNGNKVVAQGFTPQLRVNSEFHWEMSLDGGITWQLVKDNEGKPVPAQGPKGDDGDADLTITKTGDVILIVYKGVTYTLPKLSTMTLTTAKNVGEKIGLWINAAAADQPDVWIDLNNNGIRKSGEAVYFGEHHYYTIGSQTITIYGKVTQLGCEDNDLKVLDVSHNTALTWLACSNNNFEELDVTNNAALTELWCNKNELTTLNVSNNTALTQLFCHENQLTSLNVSHNTALRNLTCYSNKISGDNMTALVNNLPIRTAGDEGIFCVIALGDPDEQNVCTTAQVGIATGKNWIVRDADDNPYPGS
jgi:hypothetical protein